MCVCQRQVKITEMGSDAFEKNILPSSWHQIQLLTFEAYHRISRSRNYQYPLTVDKIADKYT